MNVGTPTSPASLFEAAFAEIVTNYDDWRFFCERDIEWTLQQTLWRYIDDSGLNVAVSNQYPIGPGRHLDLAIRNTAPNDGSFALSPTLTLPVGVELKYEPSHSRHDILRSKFPVCDFREVLRDVDRLAEWVRDGRLSDGYAVFVDEGACFSRREAHGLGEWRSLRAGVDRTLSVHWAHITRAEV